MKTKALPIMCISVMHVILFFCTTIMLIGSSCKKENPKPNPPTNDEEVITACHLIVTDSASGLSKTYTYTDSDGVGGKAPYFGGNQQSDSVLILSEQSVYNLRIVLLNQLKQPVDTVSNEVKEEGDAHMVFFNPETAQQISLQPRVVSLQPLPIYLRYNDYDQSASKWPIGLHSTLYPKSKTITSGVFKIVLKHQPNVKNGTFTPGETDLEVVFKCVIM